MTLRLAVFLLVSSGIIGVIVGWLGFAFAFQDIWFEREVETKWADFKKTTLITTGVCILVCAVATGLTYLGRWAESG